VIYTIKRDCFSAIYLARHSRLGRAARVDPNDDPITALVKCNSARREPYESRERKLGNFAPSSSFGALRRLRAREREREARELHPGYGNYLSSSNASIPEISINEIIELKQMHVVRAALPRVVKTGRNEPRLPVRARRSDGPSSACY